MRFVVDCMLGKLAKWLKIMGFDAVFFNRIEDDELLGVAENENRVLLTRDTGLMERSSHLKALFIEHEDWRKQLAQVVSVFNLRKQCEPYSRCIECNRALKKIPKEKARNLVTPFVYDTVQEFALCPQCGRVYWKGTHHLDMDFTIEELLDNGLE